MPETNPPPSDSFTAEGSPTLQQLIEHFVELLTSPEKLERLETTIANGAAKGGAIAGGAARAVLEPLVKVSAVPLALIIGQVLAGVLNAGEPLYDEFGKIAIDSLLGARPRPKAIPDDVGARILERLAPPGGEVAPSIDGAQQYLSMLTHLNVESWLLGLFGELMGESIELLGHAGGSLEQLAELRETVIQIMGGGRITRRVLAPFIDAGIVAPAKWYTNKLYRPELLSSAAAIEAWTRGDLTADAVDEELGRQGWSAQRIGLMRENARKRLSLADLFYRHYRGELSDADVAREARALGYDEGTALELLAIDNAQRIETLQAPIISEAVSNYVAGDVDEKVLIAAVEGAAPNKTDADRMVSTARARRVLHVTRISLGELKQLVKDGIQTVSDYRQALERHGYPPTDVDLLDLQLRVELQKVKDADSARAEQKADKAAAAARAADAKAARDADVAARKARAQFPALAVYKAAYVHGLIEREVLGDALTRDGIVLDADLYLGDADADRAAYLIDQDKRTKAAAIAAAGGLSVAQLEESVLEGVITLTDFDGALLARQLPDGDRAVLVKLLQVRIDNRAKADAERKAAEKRAAAKGASGADWIRAVRLGVRSIDDYRAWLHTIGTSDVSIAVLIDLLSQEMTADADAKAKRTARDAAAAAKGLPLAERRRAVILGVRPRAWYADAIASQGWPIDDQLADLDLLDVEIENTAAAAARRDAIAAKDTGATLSLSQLDAAFTTGLITLAEFRGALTDRRYAAGDVDLLVQLAAQAIPNVRAAAAAESGATVEQLGKPIPLADLKRSVLRGITSPADYEGQLLARGFALDAAALMRQAIEEMIGVERDTLTAKVAAAVTKADNGITLAELLAAFDAGELDAGQLQDAITSAGGPRDAALVLSRLQATFGSGA